MKKKIVQTAGHDALGEFAPEFAHYNDDVLFGENWNNDTLPTKCKCIVTLTSLISQGITDSSLKYHLLNAKNNGVSREEIAAIITHIAFYAGWPKAWAAFNLAKEVWNEKTLPLSEKDKYQNSIFFPIGNPNDAYAKYFIGQSYLSVISKDQVFIANVTFEPSCRNNWHIHHASKGGGQILICVGGEGIYQEYGKKPVIMKPGDVVNIPANVKHWHGAAKDSWFSHLAVEVAGENSSNEWCEPVNDEEYAAANEK